MKVKFEIEVTEEELQAFLKNLTISEAVGESINGVDLTDI